MFLSLYITNHLQTRNMPAIQLVNTLCDRENGAGRGGSTPYPGAIQDLTFNLLSNLADQHLSANALFWITVWITALDLVPRAKVQAHRSVVHGP